MAFKLEPDNASLLQRIPPYLIPRISKSWQMTWIVCAPKNIPADLVAMFLTRLKTLIKKKLKWITPKSQPTLRVTSWTLQELMVKLLRLTSSRQENVPTVHSRSLIANPKSPSYSTGRLRWRELKPSHPLVLTLSKPNLKTTGRAQTQLNKLKLPSQQPN